MLTVTGIIEDVSRFHLNINAIAPFRTLKLFYDYPDFLNQYGSWNYYTYFRLQENGDPQVLTSKINKYYTGRVFWEDNPPEFSLRPLKEIYYTQVKNDFSLTKASKPMLMIYLLVAVFILIIACVNFINLAIAKASTRSREIGVRKITGAEKHNLITQFLGESVIYAFLATFFALIVMEILRPVFNNLVQRDLTLLTLGWGWLALLILLLPVVIGVIAGLYPAFYLTHFNAVVTIKGVKTRGKESLFFRRALIVLQFTISIILIIATFTVYRQLNYFRNKDVGFNKENIILLHMNSSLNMHRSAFKEMLMVNSSIKGFSLSTQSLDNVGWQENIEVEQENKPYTYLGTDTEFIPLMGLEMADGRSFRQDTPSDSGKVIINEEAMQYFGLQYPATGKWIGTGDRRFEVLGVIRDFHYRSLHSPIGPLIMGLRKDWLSTASIRIDNRNLAETIQYIESVWNKLSPDFLFEYTFLDEQYQNMYNSEKRLGRTFVYLAVLAIFIACIGLLGLSAFIAQLRMKEIGIRKTLGDTTKGIVMRTSREFFILVILSGFIAMPLSYILLKEWLNTFAYHVKQDAFVMAGACLIALIVALVTVYLQINRIADSNPVDALRYE
jgi:putative ABC transport system permease protein